MTYEQNQHSFLGNVPAPPPRHATIFRRAGRWCLLAAIFLAPFFFLPLTNDPENVNTFFIVGILVVAAFIFFLGSVLEEHQIEYPHTWLSLAVVLFLVVQAVSACFSVIPSLSFWGKLSAPDSFAAFVIYALLFFLFSFFFRRKDILKIGLAIGGGFFIATVINLFHPAGAHFDWGILLAALIAALIVIRPGDLTGRGKTIFFLLVLMAFIGLAALNYQFLWLAIAVFTVILAALRFGPREHFQYAFVIIVVALFFALISPRLSIFFHTSGDLRPGVTATASTVQGTLKAQNILIGTGPATFPLDFEAFRPVTINQTSFWSEVFSQGHDFAITLLATGGILSFLLFLTVAILAIQPFLHIQSLENDIAMVVSGAAFLMSALFIYPGFFAGFVILFSLLGLMAGEHSRRDLSFAALPRVGFFSFSIVTLVFAAASLGVVFLAGEQYIAEILFAQSNALAASGNLSAAFSKVNEAIALDRADEYLRGASGIILAEAKVLAKSNNQSEQSEVPAAITSAIQSAQGAVLQNSHDPLNWGNLGSIYESAMPVIGGTDTLSFGSYQNAATLDPSDPRWDVDMARVLMESAALLPSDIADQQAIQAKQASAENILEKAIALKDDYTDPRVLLVQLYLQEGNLAQATQRVQELAQQNPLDPGVAFELGYLYYQGGQMDQALAEFQVATILNPNYANALYYMGLIYDAKGEETQALAEFQKILASNPDNGEVSTIIANLQAGLPALRNDTVSTSTTGLSQNAPASSAGGKGKGR